MLCSENDLSYWFGMDYTCSLRYTEMKIISISRYWFDCLNADNLAQSIMQMINVSENWSLISKNVDFQQG